MRVEFFSAECKLCNSTLELQKVRVVGISLLMGIIAVVPLAVANAQSLTWLGTFGGLRSTAYGVSADGRVVVGYVSNYSGGQRAFRWTQDGGMEDLNITYANLLTDGSVLAVAYALSPDGRYIVGWGRNARTGRTEGFLLDTCATHNGDGDNNGCIDDADLIAILSAFGSSGSGLDRADVNCDGRVDEADLLTVLFHFGMGC